MAVEGWTHRTQLLLTAAIVLALVTVQVALGRDSGGASTAATDSKLAKKVTKLTKRVTQLESQVSGLSGQVSSPGPPNGPAGGDLRGIYPNPTLRVASTFFSAGLNVATGLNNCGGTAINNAWNTQPENRLEVGYYRDIQGTVFLQGDAMECGTAPNPIFTLPAGFRPGRDLIEAATGLANALVPVVIRVSTGAVEPNTTFALGTIDLTGINFRCAPSGQNGCP